MNSFPSHADHQTRLVTGSTCHAVPGMKIDYVFVTNNINVLEHGVLSDNWDGLWASDHLPVLAEIEIR